MGNSTLVPGRESHHHTQKEVIQRMELVVFVFSCLPPHLFLSRSLFVLCHCWDPQVWGSELNNGT